MIVPDQLRSAVKGPDRYDAELNPAYLEMAQYYGVAVIPAGPAKPKDKAKVEVGVLIAYSGRIRSLVPTAFDR